MIKSVFSILALTCTVSISHAATFSKLQKCAAGHDTTAFAIVGADFNNINFVKNVIPGIKKAKNCSDIDGLFLQTMGQGDPSLLSRVIESTSNNVGPLVSALFTDEISNGQSDRVPDTAKVQMCINNPSYNAKESITKIAFELETLNKISNFNKDAALEFEEELRNIFAMFDKCEIFAKDVYEFSIKHEKSMRDLKFKNNMEIFKQLLK